MSACLGGRVLAELVLDCRNHHGEGVLWDDRARHVRWTDIHGCALWSYDPESGRSESTPMPDRVAAFAPRGSGGFILAFADRVSLWHDDGSEDVLTRFEPHLPGTRLNDGRTDRSGRFVVGGMDEANGRPVSSVIRVNTDLSVETLLTGVACANSTCFSADGSTMFFADTPERRIRAYAYDPESGHLGQGRVHADFAGEPGLPDGSCVDAEGGVWNAEWEGGRVVRVGRDGRIDAIVSVPVWKPTCCAFGGDDLATLYITTSRLGSDPARLAAEPASGGLFAARPGVRGVPDVPFAG
jgi:L-arabinonolactonase